MLFTIVINYSLALALDHAKNRSRSKLFLGIAILTNLAVLGYYKYGDFIMDNLNQLRLSWDMEVIAYQAQPLPIGLSFFIFQAIAYLLDVYWGKISAQKNPLRLGLYIALFPQLIAGPIVRYTQVAKQLAHRRLSWVTSAKGLERFFIGLAKKVLIADQLGYVADQIFALPPEQLGAGAAWLGLICYAGQIYFDFSGYSDMAIGIGRTLGFRFPENFNYPYVAQSIRAFWRRWHMSLSSWFRDYLYIPLGGNRKGIWRTQFNLLLVFFLCGLWHGAAWNFCDMGTLAWIILGLRTRCLGEMA